MKLLLYCTKAKPYLIKQDDEFDITKDSYDHRILWDKMPILNGKIVAECDFEVEEIIPNDWNSVIQYWYSIELLKNSCLDALDLRDYLKGKNGYALHIKNLHIFDEPRELNDCYKEIPPDETGCKYEFIRKAPQNMMYAYDYFGDNDKKVLISIRPEWLYKILNGEKTIEVRKKVLKEML